MLLAITHYIQDGNHDKLLEHLNSMIYDDDKKKSDSTGPLSIDLHRVDLLHQLALRRRFIISMVFYVPYLILLMYLTLSVFPSPATSLRGREAVNGVFLEEEFENVSFGKSFKDVANEEELWEWVRGPLSSGVYQDEEYPQPILYSNLLMGCIQFRQVLYTAVDQVSDSSCSEIGHTPSSRMDSLPVGSRFSFF